MPWITCSRNAPYPGTKATRLGRSMGNDSVRMISTRLWRRMRASSCCSVRGMRRTRRFEDSFRCGPRAQVAGQSVSYDASSQKRSCYDIVVKVRGPYQYQSTTVTRKVASNKLWRVASDVPPPNLRLIFDADTDSFFASLLSHQLTGSKTHSMIDVSPVMPERLRLDR